MNALYGDSFGGIQSARYADAAMRQQASQAAMAQLMSALSQARQQQNFQQQMAERAQQQAQSQAYQMQQAQEAARQHTAQQQNQDRNFQLNRDYFEWQKGQPTKQDATAEKDLAGDLSFRIQNRLPYNPTDYEKLPPAVRDPLISFDAATRQQESEALDKAKEAALAGRRIRIIQQRAKELSTAPSEGMFRPDLGSPEWASQPSQNPAKVARGMTDRLAPLALRYAPLLDPKAKLVTIDAATGELIPHPDLIKPWMGTPQGPPEARQLRMTDTGTGQAGAGAPNTGTSPRVAPSIFKNQSGTVDIQLPDGSIVTGPSTNAAALLKRFPGAQVLITN